MIDTFLPFAEFAVALDRAFLAGWRSPASRYAECGCPTRLFLQRDGVKADISSAEGLDDLLDKEREQEWQAILTPCYSTVKSYFPGTWTTPAKSARIAKMWQWLPSGWEKSGSSMPQE